MHIALDQSLAYLIRTSGLPRLEDLGAFGRALEVFKNNLSGSAVTGQVHAAQLIVEPHEGCDHVNGETGNEGCDHVNGKTGNEGCEHVDIKTRNEGCDHVDGETRNEGCEHVNGNRK